MGVHYQKMSDAARESWSKLSPAQREYRGFLISIGHRHKQHIEQGIPCDCEQVRQEFLQQWREKYPAPNEKK